MKKKCRFFWKKTKKPHKRDKSSLFTTFAYKRLSYFILFTLYWHWHVDGCCGWRRREQNKIGKKNAPSPQKWNCNTCFSFTSFFFLKSHDLHVAASQFTHSYNQIFFSSSFSFILPYMIQRKTLLVAALFDITQL